MLLAQQYAPDLTKLKDYFIQTPLGYMVRGDMSGAVDKLGSNAKLRVDAMMNPETGLNAGLDFLTGGAGTITHKFLKPSMVGKAKLTGPDKSAMTRYEKKLKENPAFRRSEEMREAGKTELEQIPIGERTVLPPESLLGKVAVPVAGDMTRTGAKLRNLEGVPLQEEVIIQGGPLYSLQHKNMGSKNAWASNYGAASSKQKNFDKSAEEFGTDDVLGVYTGMNQVTGSHFAAPESKIFVDTMDVLKPKVADIKEADQVIKDLLASQGKKVDFTSLRSDKIYDQMQKSGDLRRAITTVLRLPKFQSKGFANAEDMTRIIREPLLKDAIRGDSGLTIFQAKPNAGINPYAYHQSYDSGIQGEYLGGLLESVPAEIMFPKTFEKLGKQVTESGKPYTYSDKLGSLARAHHAEMLDQQWLDNLMKYLSTKRK
jgi:hypothetical protein